MCYNYVSFYCNYINILYIILLIWYLIIYCITRLYNVYVLISVICILPTDPCIMCSILVFHCILWFVFQEQYSFLYEIVAEALDCGDTSIVCSQFPETLQKMRQVCLFSFYFKHITFSANASYFYDVLFSIYTHI